MFSASFSFQQISATMLSSQKIVQSSVALIFITLSLAVLGFPQTGSSTATLEITNNSNHSCPPSVDKSKPLRYHLQSQKCYKTKTKGPCGNNQIFFSVENSQTYGDCDCPISGVDVPWVYHVQTDKCYKSYEQAYCPTGQWLIFNENEDVQCVSNKCSDTIFFEDGQSTSKMVLFKKKCVTLHDPTPYCKDGEIVSFDPNSVTPTCIKMNEGDTTAFSIVKTTQLKCKAGTRRDIVGKCRTAYQASTNGSSFG